MEGIDRRRFLDDWLRSSVTICADGALSILKHIARDMKIDHATLFPDYIVGDLDSSDQTDLDEYTKMGGEVIRISSQDMTDFDKCIQVYKEREEIDQGSWLLVYGSIGGARLDHTMAAFHPLYQNLHLRIALVQGKGYGFVVSDATNELVVDEALQGTQCGLFPLAGKSVVSTTGLKWNLDNRTMKYGDLISVSNEILESRVTIATDRPLFFTIQYYSE